MTPFVLKSPNMLIFRCILLLASVLEKQQDSQQIEIIRDRGKQPFVFSRIDIIQITKRLVVAFDFIKQIT
ncbi:MAG: hypothetical protein IK067_06605, partial [Prevotella sp.]|nr:hypothetical protein [Prevotella sp.]